MENRKRNLNLHVRFTKEEKEMIKKVASLKDMSVTDLILQWTINEYEKIEKEQIKND